MGNQEVVLIGTMSLRMSEGVRQRFSFHQVPSEESLDTLPADVRQRTAVIIAANKIGARTPAMLPALRFVLNLGIGYDQLDLPTLKAAGLAAANLAGLADECVADMAMALLLDVARGTTRGDRFVRAGKWGKQPFPFVNRVTAKRLGILGLGSIGLAIAKRAEGFRMSVAYHNRRRRSDVPYRYAESVRALAAMSDHLVIAAPGGAETRHLVNAAVLAALPPHGVVVNIGRGSIIDQEALIEALAADKLWGAGLDVLDGEPAVPPRLLALDNVVLTPHRAGSTHETSDDAVALTIRTLEAWFRDGTNIAPI
ncbi:MAG: 2-hydroxyacid dehydrogenase [Alphaproteobacteria bacterium]|nr:2-hydroxyacid dehydrogenase [Alphaproteobacteria bacterium]